MKKYISGAIAASAFFVAGTANALLIDNFDNGSLSLSLNNAAVGVMDGPTNEAAAGIIGGSRTGTLTMSAIQGGNADADAEVVNGLLDISNKIDANATVEIMWNSNGAGLGGIDLTAGGAIGFFLSFPNPIDNELTISFLINGVSDSSQTFPDGSSGDDFFILFADAGIAAATDSILMTVSDGFGWDAQIDLVETRERPPGGVPEPATLLLMGAGLAGLGSMRRRKKA